MIEVGTRRVDFLIKDVLSVEIKAIIELEDVHLAQAMNYLEVDLLINFGSRSLTFKRVHNKKFKGSEFRGNPKHPKPFKP